MENTPKDIIEAGPWTGCSRTQVIAWAESESYADVEYARYAFFDNVLFLCSVKTDDAIESRLTRKMFDEELLWEAHEVEKCDKKTCPFDHTKYFDFGYNY